MFLHLVASFLACSEPTSPPDVVPTPPAAPAAPAPGVPGPPPGGGQGPVGALAPFSTQGRVAEVAVLAWADGDASGLTRAQVALKASVATFPHLTFDKLLLAWTQRVAGDLDAEAATLATVPVDRRPLYTRFFAGEPGEVLPYLRYHVWDTCRFVPTTPCPAEPPRPDAWPVFEQIAWVSHAENRLSTWTGGKPLAMADFLALVGVKPGLRVADVGAGEGWFTLPLARAVGPSGRVTATEIDPAYTDFITYTARELGVAQVATVVQSTTDVKLPAGEFDLVFLCEVFKAVSTNAQARDPDHVRTTVTPFLASIHRALVPGGRFVIVDHDSPESSDKDLSISTLQHLVEAAGFRFVSRSDAYRPVQVVLVYERP